MTLTKGIYYLKAFNYFRNIKEFYNKENGCQYLHYIQLFREGEVATEEALELTENFCNKIIKDLMIFFSSLHKSKTYSSMIANSVSYVNSYKFQCSRNDLKKWKKFPMRLTRNID